MQRWRHQDNLPPNAPIFPKVIAVQGSSAVEVPVKWQRDEYGRFVGRLETTDFPDSWSSMQDTSYQPTLFDSEPSQEDEIFDIEGYNDAFSFSEDVRAEDDILGFLMASYSDRHFQVASSTPHPTYPSRSSPDSSISSSASQSWHPFTLTESSSFSLTNLGTPTLAATSTETPLYTLPSTSSFPSTSSVDFPTTSGTVSPLSASTLLTSSSSDTSSGSAGIWPTSSRYSSTETGETETSTKWDSTSFASSHPHTTAQSEFPTTSESTSQREDFTDSDLMWISGSSSALFETSSQGNPSLDTSVEATSLDQSSLTSRSPLYGLDTSGSTAPLASSSMPLPTPSTIPRSTLQDDSSDLMTSSIARLSTTSLYTESVSEEEQQSTTAGSFSSISEPSSTVVPEPTMGTSSEPPFRTSSEAAVTSTDADITQSNTWSFDPASSMARTDTQEATSSQHPETTILETSDGSVAYSSSSLSTNLEAFSTSLAGHTPSSSTLDFLQGATSTKDESTEEATTTTYESRLTSEGWESQETMSGAGSSLLTDDATVSSSAGTSESGESSDPAKITDSTSLPLTTNPSSVPTLSLSTALSEPLTGSFTSGLEVSANEASDTTTLTLPITGSSSAFVLTAGTSSEGGSTATDSLELDWSERIESSDAPVISELASSASTEDDSRYTDDAVVSSNSPSEQQTSSSASTTSWSGTDLTSPEESFVDSSGTGISDSSVPRSLLSSSSSESSEGSSETSTEIPTTKKEPSRPLEFLPLREQKDLMPLEALVLDPDLQSLGSAVKQNDKYDVLRKVGMTIFAPVDAAFMNLPIDLDAVQDTNTLKKPTRAHDANLQAGASMRRMRRDASGPSGGGSRQGSSSPRKLSNCDPYENGPCHGSQSLQHSVDLIGSRFGQMTENIKQARNKTVLEDFEKLIMFHVVKRIIPPGMIQAKQKLSLRTEFKGRNLEVGVYTDIDGKKSVMVAEGQARVVEIVVCRNGFIYKIDRPLFPAWNMGAPTLVDGIRMNPRFTKLRYLLDKTGMFDAWAQAGPVTMLLIPDEAWKVDGLMIPPCFFKALVRPQNADLLAKLLKWTTIPGLWTKEDIQATSWLPNGIAPSLSVTTIDMSVWAESQKSRQDVFANRESIYDPSLHWAHDVSEEAIEAIPLAPPGNRLTLIEGKEVVDWDIPFYNGFGHTIAELPLRPDIDLRAILWDCMDMFCGECPIITKFLLKYLDGGGLLPDVTNPKAYIVPPGPRPEWVCSGTPKWFPPGWEEHEWYKYLEYAKTGNSKMARQLAYQGWRQAAVRVGDLDDKLREAEVHLRQIWHHYGNPSNYLLGETHDPNLLIGWIRNKRSLEIKPRICDGTAPKKPGPILDVEDPWDGDGDAMWGGPPVAYPLSLREDFYNAVGREKVRKVTMEDLKYLTQWL